MKRKTKISIMIIMLVVITIVIVASIWYADVKEAQRNKERQLHLFGIDWPEPIIKLYNISASDFVAEFGQPQRVEYNRQYSESIMYSTTLFYEKFCVNYIYMDDEERFANIIVTSGDVAMWRGGIGLGSTRAEVGMAFSDVAKDPAERGAYFDSLWAIGFSYTENDIVKEIILFAPW